MSFRGMKPEEISTALAQANAKVAERLYQDCMKDDPDYQRSRMFWLKTRAGWRETDRHEIVGDSGGPVRLEVVYEDKSIPE